MQKTLKPKVFKGFFEKPSKTQGKIHFIFQTFHSNCVRFALTRTFQATLDIKCFTWTLKQMFHSPFSHWGISSSCQSLPPPPLKRLARRDALAQSFDTSNFGYARSDSYRQHCCQWLWQAHPCLSSTPSDLWWSKHDLTRFEPKPRLQSKAPVDMNKP